MLYNEQPLPLPFYDRLTYQERYKPNNPNPEGSYLIAPHNRLIPFQFRYVTSVNTLQYCKVFDFNGDLVETLDHTEIDKATVNGYDVYYWKAGAAFPLSGEGTLDLPCGLYYLEVSVNNVKQFSEIFITKQFDTPENFPYLLIEYSNSVSIGPVYYADGYVNRIYLDTFILNPPPNIFREALQDGYGNEIIITQRMVTAYNFAPDPLPPFLASALAFMSINSNVIITEVLTGRTGNAYNISVKSSPEIGGSLFIIIVEFDQNVIYFKNTCDGLTIPETEINQEDDRFDGIVDDGLNNDNINYEDI